MNHDEMDRMLRQTLDDLKLSRTEKRAMGAVLADATLSRDDQAWLRSRAFDLAREELEGRENRLVLDWLEEVVKVIARAARSSARETRAEAWFTPGGDTAERIAAFIRAARRTLDVCVFTITDDALTRELFDARRRGVALRIITDDDKSFDRGSDIERLERAGVPVRMDRSDAHMHHKFAIADGATLLTGSYNWTRGASQENHENVLLTDDPRLVGAYARTFEALWSLFG